MRFLTLLVFFVSLAFVVKAEDMAMIFSDEEIGSFDDAQIDPEKSFSENLKETKEVPVVENDQTWLDELSERNKKRKVAIDVDDDTPILDSKNTLKGLVKERKIKPLDDRRSNASVFDISGVMLRMNIFQAEAALRKRGYKKLSQEMQVPNFIKWRNEEKCRNSGVYGYERLAVCVSKLSKDEKAEYIEIARYNSRETKEEIQIFLTSNFTGNKVYKIIYSTEVPTIKGNSPKNEYLRNVKVFEFWRKINQKYGAPDDETEISWGLGDNRPYLKAQTGFLLLEDPMLLELDWTRMSREDQKYLNTNMYNF